MALIPTFDPNIEAYKIFHDKHTNSARVFIADIKNKLQVEALGKECLSKQIAQHYNIEKCGTDWLLVLSPVTTEGIEALVHLLTPDSTPAPEPNPTPVPYYLAEEHIIGWVENLREVAQLNDWISIEAIMDGLAEPLKEAVWERLDVSERNAIKELKRAATQKPEPAPTQTNKPEPRTKERRVKIPREAKLEKGQSIVSEDGEIIGKVILVKNAHSADVRFYKKSIIKRTKKSDLDTYSYHREWIIGEEWAETFYLKVEGGYKAKFWEINKSQWHLTILRNGLIVTQYILREPEIYQYDSPREWAESRVKLFLETM